MNKILCAFLLCFFASRVLAVETIDPGEIKPGMKGYGLTVLSGYKIERFDVEVIDVMPHSLPGADMILVKCSGAGLEKSKLIAGMSGSPVYIEGKLAGAIAYTWGFQLDPIAGITPIKAMIEAGSVSPKPVVTASATPAKESLFDPSIKPIGCPVLISGLDPSLMDQAKKLLEPFNLGPVSMGGGNMEDPEAPSKVEPGSAVGVQLVAGDLNLAAVGTATMVDGNTIFAFGHGFFNGGPVALPLALAKVNTVIANSQLSFKLASPVREVGTLKGDFPLAVSGKLNEKPNLIPVTIAVNNLAMGNKKTFHFFVADHPVLTVSLVQICLMQALSLTGAISENSTVALDMDLSLRGYPKKIHYKDMFALNKGSFTPEYLIPATLFATNPYKKVDISEVSFDLGVKPGWDVAEIKSVWSSKVEVMAGETITIGVSLRRFQGDTLEKSFEFQVPKDAHEMVNLAFGGGEQMPLDIAQPDSIDDLIAAFHNLPKPTWLVMQYQKSGAIVDLDGERMRGLPPSAQSIMAGFGSTEGKRLPDFEFITIDTPYIIKGAAAIQLKVKPESGRTKK
jgi:hypothetical protein